MQQGKTYLHIGLQKTASTYLQHKIFPNMSGLSYVGRPYTQENYAFNCLQYADDSLYSSDVLAEEIKVIREDVGAGPLLISDELFSGYSFYGWINRGIIARRLAEVLPDAEIIVFLRGQADLVGSLYNQYVKTGRFSGKLDSSFLYRPGDGCFSYERWKTGDKAWDYLDRPFQSRHVLSSSLFLYSRVLAMYESLFSKVHVFLYEHFAAEPQECLERLENIVSAKIPRDLIGQQELVNKRLDNTSLRMRLAQNRFSSLRPFVPGAKYLSRFLLKPASLLLREQSEEERRTYVTELLQDAGVFEDNKRLDEIRDLGMKRYADKYFPPT